MKKTGLIILLLVSTLTMSAQYNNSFFDEKGGVKPETTELAQAADTLVTIFHRTDDVVWSRIVYRIIDMRYKQNYQLYFPTYTGDPEYKNLLKLILDAITNGLPTYRKSADNIKPAFDDQLTPTEIASLFMTGDPLSDDTDWDLATSGDFLLNYDSLENKISFNDYSYAGYVRNQIKFMTQEVIFFNKHTSRLHTKIIAIAPIYSEGRTLLDDDYMQFLYNSTLFWISFDQLRPYLATQVVIPSGNDKARLTYDEFFTKRLYFSYIAGDSNMFSRLLLKYAITPEKIKAEQHRIETELLNFEQDLWEN